MNFAPIAFNSDKFYRLIFQTILWILWIVVPIISAHDERGRLFSIAMIPVALSNIPLFLINSEWLIPKVFRKKGIGYYLLSLLVLVVLYGFFQTLFKEWLVEDLQHKRSLFWMFVPVIFVTAISTGYGFINYLLREEKNRQEEQQERLQSEVSFLRSQISPHFIFNVLNSIVYLIRIKSDQAEKVTLELSELMRYMLYESGDQQVPLAKEIGYLENYVELQKVRFGEDVDINLVVEGNRHGTVIEPMLLIPFVENAFKHGVGLVENPSINIHLTINEKDLIFTVTNKKTTDTAAEKDDASGIGLRNVSRRLELLYPERHQLTFSDHNGLFEVILIVQLSSIKI
jgi:two-component system LytT family sensor kinase